MPMTDRTGAIEWVDNTKILKDIINLGMVGMDAKKQSQVHAEAFKSNFAFLQKKGKGDWHQMCEKTSADDTVDNYDARRTAIQDFVRDKSSKKQGDSLIQAALRKLASGPEAYLMLKLGFSRSFAAVNICQYLLGIGDRHLSNSMIDVTTGEVVGIDFGHAFGSATELLPIPELMPFRLTPEIEAAMQPHSNSGLFRNCMGHVLRTMQDNQDTLIAMADVFINEPLLDWDLRATNDIKSGKYGSVDVDEGDSKTVAYAKNKVDSLRQKLNRVNPVDITLDLVNKNKSLKQKQGALRKVQDCVRGQRGCKRKEPHFAQKKCASVLDQVDVLIDLATDKNILGRTYSGWAAWW